MLWWKKKITYGFFNTKKTHSCIYCNHCPLTTPTTLLFTLLNYLLAFLSSAGGQAPGICQRECASQCLCVLQTQTRVFYHPCTICSCRRWPVAVRRLCGGTCEWWIFENYFAWLAFLGWLLVIFLIVYHRCRGPAVVDTLIPSDSPLYLFTDSNNHIISVQLM